MRRQCIARSNALKDIRRGATVAIAIVIFTASGWTQGNVQTDFTPAKEADQLTLDARSDPAKATTDDEATLVSKGYVKIGTVTASQGGKETSAEVTQLLDAAALAKAAEAGGDLVRFEKEGAPRGWDEPKFKRRCKEWQTSTSQTTDAHGTVHEKKKKECIAWEEEAAGTKRTIERVESRGTVWRYVAAN